MNKFLAELGAVLVGSILSSLVILLLVHVVIDLSNLFDIPLTLYLTYSQIFGVVFLLRLITQTPKALRKDVIHAFKQPREERMKVDPKDKLLGSVAVKGIAALIILSGWLTAYVAYWLFL